MTQFQFDLIKKIIVQGAPALAEELCTALNNLVASYDALAAENEQFKAQANAPTDEPATEEATDN